MFFSRRLTSERLTSQMALSMSEWTPKLRPDLKPLMAKANVNAQEDVVADVETKAETGCGFQIMEASNSWLKKRTSPSRM